MSRHEIPALDPAHTVIVGWDPPLQTYFAQVIDRQRQAAGDDDCILDWAGTWPREIHELDQLARVLRPHAELPIDTRTALYADKDEGR